MKPRNISADTQCEIKGNEVSFFFHFSFFVSARTVNTHSALGPARGRCCLISLISHASFNMIKSHCVTTGSHSITVVENTPLLCEISHTSRPILFHTVTSKSKLNYT